MLAGWTTVEARLASAVVILLVFAAGMLPARRVQASPVPAVTTLNQPVQPAVRHQPMPTVEATLAAEPDAVPTGELALLNQDRAQAGLPPLAASASLDAVAGIRAAQLMTDGITHYRPGARMLAAVELMQANHIPYVWHGENIIWAGGMPSAAMPAFFNDWWMGSPVHRDNILNPHYRSVGIGVARSGDAVYMVEVFTDQPAGGLVQRYRPKSRQAITPI
jgi:uncharacterized protein YkwD